MRAKELFNKLTLGNKLIVVGLAIGLCSTAHSQELVTAALTPEQFQGNRCDSSNTNWRTSQSDFLRACADANLGSSVVSCTRRLENCESSDNSHDYCIGSATSRSNHREDEREQRDQERELQERKDSLLADYEEKQTEIQRAREEQDRVQQDLQSTLAGIDNEKVQAQIQLETDLQAIVDQTGNTRDAIDLAQLSLREFVVKNEIECRTKALEEKNRYVRATRGRQITVNQLFGRTGLSVNQVGSIRYEQVLRNCTALYTDTGRTTGFGSQYRLQTRAIQVQKNTLNRQMAGLETQRQSTIRNSRLALAAMDEQKQMATINARTANARAAQNVQLLETQRNNITTQLNQIEGRMVVLGREVSTTQVSSLIEIGRNTLTDQEAAEEDEEVTVADQSQITAYNTAAGLREMLSNYEHDRGEACGEQETLADTTAAIAALAAADDDAEPEDDGTTAVATELDEDNISIEREVAAADDGILPQNR